MRSLLLPGNVHGEKKSSVNFEEVVLTESLFKSDQRISSHRHQTACFRLVLDGITSDFTRNKTCAGKPSTMVYHPFEELHWNHWHLAGRSFTIELKPNFFSRYPQLKSTINGIGAVDFQSGPTIDLAYRIYYEFCNLDRLSPLSVEGLILELVVASTRLIDRNDAGNRPPVWLIQVKDLLHERFTEDLTLAEISLRVGVNPSHLARSFRRYFQCTLGEYARRLKVDLARNLLNKSDIPLVEVAMRAGFSDQSHLTSTFRRYTGMTPGAYRLLVPLR